MDLGMYGCWGGRRGGGLGSMEHLQGGRGMQQRKALTECSSVLLLAPGSMPLPSQSLTIYIVKLRGKTMDKNDSDKS